MKLKVLLFAVACFLIMKGLVFPEPVDVDLRDYVCMVQSGYQTGTGIGSGWKFAVEYEPGKFTVLILTNSHVVSGADKHAVVFLYPDRTETRFEDVTMLVDDPWNDVAVLSLMGRNPPGGGFQIDTIRYPEGTMVETIGYPDGAWSHEVLNSITNSSVRLDIKKPVRVLDFIQVFSGISHGSSGGTLLIKDNSKLGHSVIGINARSSQYDKRSFAIPPHRFIPAIIQALQKVFPDWEHEDNDTMDSSEKFERTASGCFQGGGDVDWYKFHSDAGEFRLGAYSSELMEVSLYDAVGKLLDSKSGHDLSLHAGMETEADLFIAVRAAQSRYFQTYALSSAFVAADKYEPDSKESPLASENNTWLQRSLYSGDEDWFSVKVLNDSMAIESEVPFELFDGDDLVTRGTGSRTPVYIDAMAGKTCLIRVFNNDPCEYRFRVSFLQQEIEPNNIREEAQLLETGLMLKASTNGNDKDWFRIQGKGKIGIDIEGGVLIDLYDSRGRIISGSGEEEKHVEGAFNGQLFINIRPASVYREDYTLVFTEHP
jgi:hypothetical protein